MDSVTGGPIQFLIPCILMFPYFCPELQVLPFVYVAALDKNHPEVC